MNMPLKSKWIENIPVVLLMFITLILRLCFPEDFSLSNDELSALVRTKFVDFSQLIQYGVIETDPHPAGIQVFLYYYVQWFGYNAWIVRLPFVLTGVLAILPFYLTVQRWFDAKTAMIASSFLAFTVFFMQMGQLARPYAFGLLFTQCLVYYWTKFYLSNRSFPLRPWIGMIIFSTLCLYTHYFAALFAFVVGFTAFLTSHSVKRRWILAYGAIVTLLYLPHIFIFLSQIQREDITGWLPMPEWSFLHEHLYMLLNNSPLLLLVIISFFIAGILNRHETMMKKRFRNITLWWFLAPILVAYIYSFLNGAVLMDRVLLFSAPFFYVFISSVFTRFKKIWIPYVIIIVVLADTFFIHRYFDTPFTENIKGIAKTIRSNDNNYDAGQILRIGNYNDTRYVNFYNDILGREIKFDLKDIRSRDSLYRLIEFINNSEKPFIEKSWACVNEPYEVAEIIKLKYPEIVTDNQYYNSGISLYKRSEVARDTLVWKRVSNKDSILVDEEMEYSFMQRFSIDSLLEIGCDAISVSGNFLPMNNTGQEMIVVMSFEDPISKNEWHGISMGTFKPDHATKYGIITRKLPTDMSKNALLKTYIWNPKKGRSIVSDLKISAFADSKYDYYPF